MQGDLRLVKRKKEKQVHTLQKGKRKKAMGGGMMDMPRASYRHGGSCKAMKGKGNAYGKNS